MDDCTYVNPITFSSSKNLFTDSVIHISVAIAVMAPTP